MVNAPYAQMGKHFDTRNGDNLACRHCGEIIINSDTLRHYRMMDEFREWFGRPMTVNSGHRCKAYNDTLEGSAETSRHITGDATDWQHPDDFYKMAPARKKAYLQNIRNKWFEICDAYEISGGVGFYNSFVHFDSREVSNGKPAKRAFWNFSTYL